MNRFEQDTDKNELSDGQGIEATSRHMAPHIAAACLICYSTWARFTDGVVLAMVYQKHLLVCSALIPPCYVAVTTTPRIDNSIYLTWINSYLRPRKLTMAATNTATGLVDHAEADDCVARFTGTPADSKTITAPAAADATQ